MPEIRKNPILIFQVAGVANIKTNKGRKDFKVGVISPGTHPVVVDKSTGTAAIFDWEELIHLAIKEGLIEGKED